MVLRLKKFFWIFFLCIDFILLGAIVGGVYFFESSACKTTLESSLGKLLDRKVVIEKNLDLTFYPWFGVNSGPVHIFSDANGTTEQISVKKMILGVKVLPLLRGNIELDTIQVDSPLVRIDRRSNGSFNFPSIKYSAQQGSGGFGLGFINSVSIRGVAVNNATCIYHDVASSNEFEFTGISIRTGPLRKGQTVAFDIGADLNTALLDINAQAHLKGLLDFSLADHSIKISDTSLNARVDSDALFGRDNTVQATASLDFDPIEGSVNISGLVVRGNAATFSGAGKGRNLYNSPVIEGSLQSTKFDPRVLLERYLPHKISINSENVLSRAKLSCNFRVSMKGAEFNNIVMKVDDTSCSGYFSLKDFSHPWCEFNIVADYLKFDKYLPLFRRTTDSYANNSESVKTKSAKVGIDKNIAYYVRMIPCKGKLELAHFIAGGFDLKQVDLDVSPGPDVLNLNIGSGKFYDGVFTIDSKLLMSNQKSDQLKLIGSGSISEFSLNKAVRSKEKFQILSGKAAASKVSLTSTGKSIRELRSNFSAKIEAVLKGARFRPSPEYFKGRSSDILLDRAELTTLVSLPDKSSPEPGLVGQKIDMHFNVTALKPKVKVSGFFKGNIFHSILEDSFRLNFKNVDFSVTAAGTDIPVLKKPLTVRGQLGYRYDTQGLELRDGVVESNGVAVHLDTKAVGLGGKLKADGSLHLDKTECTKIFGVFGIDKPEAQAGDAYGPAEFHSSFQLDDHHLKLNVTKASLDDAVAVGTFQFPDYMKPEFSFKLYADKVDVDRFLPPDEVNVIDRIRKNNQAKTKFPEWQFPDKFLKSVKATGEVTCKFFRLFDISGEDITANVAMRDSVINVSDIVSRFHQGDLKGNLSIGFKKNAVKLNMNFDAKRFQSGPFFTEFIGRDYVKGLTDASATIVGRSSANTDFIDTMNGELFFNIKDGEYRLKSSGSEGKNKKDVKATKFSIARGHLKGVDEGRFQVKDFLLKTNFITATAKGGFDIPDDSISVIVKVNIITFPDLYLNLLNTFLSAISGVDIHISGKLRQPHVDVKGLMRWDNVFEDILGLPGKSFSFIKDALF